MIDPKIREELDIQLQQVRKLLVSDDWSVWVNFLKKERRQYLQDKVNNAVETGNLIEAQICRALMKDCLRQIELFGTYIRNTENKLKEK